MSAIERYEQAMINYIWFIEFQRVQGGVKLLRHYRKRFDDPTRPKSMGAGHIVENRDSGNRTAEMVEFIPYATPSAKPTRLTIVNQKHVFAYDKAEDQS
jgi:hypothetical protein